MRNMIYNTIIASILGSFLVAPLAHADRQGGGTLKVGVNASGVTLAEWVRFRGLEADKISFEYSWIKNAEHGLEQVTIHKADFGAQSAALVRALLNSKDSREWNLIESEPQK